MNDTKDNFKVLKDGRKLRSIRVADDSWEWWQYNCLLLGYKTPSHLFDAIAGGDVELTKKEKG